MARKTTDQWLVASRAFLAAVLLAIAGCGLKGDLYLPEEPAPEASAQEDSTQEDSDRADTETAEDEAGQITPSVE